MPASSNIPGAKVHWPAPSGDTTGQADTQLIQSVLSHMAPGQISICEFNGYYVNQPLILNNATLHRGPSYGIRPGKPRDSTVPMPPTILVANGANLNAVLTDNAFLASGTPNPSSSIGIDGFVIDGNGGNQSSGAGHGIALLTKDSVIKHNLIQNPFGCGIVQADKNIGGGISTVTMDETQICDNTIFNVYGAANIWVQHFSNQSTNTDGYMIDNIMDNAFGTFGGNGSALALQMDQTAGWRVMRNHPYALSGNGYLFNSCNNCWLEDNYIDKFGDASVSGTTYYGAQFQVAPFGRTTIRGWRANAQEADNAGAGTFVYYYVTSPSNLASATVCECLFADMDVHQISATSATPNGSTAYQFNSTTNATLYIQGFIGAQILQASTTSATPLITGTGTVTVPGNSG
jgi:hypothetical protein